MSVSHSELIGNFLETDFSDPVDLEVLVNLVRFVFQAVCSLICSLIIAKICFHSKETCL